MERIAFEYRKDEPFRVVKDGCIGTIRTMEGGGVSKYIMEVKVIGDLFEDNGHGSMAGRVYDTDGQCPALGASHFQQIKYILDKPKVIHEVKELGFMDNGTQQIKVLTEVKDTNPKLLGGIGEKWGDKQYRQGNRVYDANGVAMALTAQPLGNNGGNSYMYLTEEKSIVAMRGRNPENPSDRTVGAPTEQRLEPNEHRVAEPREDGCSNSLSTVQKDNMLLETVRIKQATKDGYIECKVGGVADLSFPDSTTRRGRVQNNGDVCPTLMAGESDICRIEKKCISTKGKENEVASTILSGYERSNMTGFNADNGVLETQVINPLKGLSENGWHFEQNVYDAEGIVRSVKAGGGSGNIPKVIETQYRIRKLTPRECYRLMAVPEESIDKMLEVNSNTQCYKQAGNSIVVNCLVAIFSQMGIQGIPRWNEGLSEKYK